MSDESSSLFDEIISSIDPDDVPLEYVIMAKVVDYYGNERILQGEELHSTMRGPDRAKLREAKVILNVRAIREAVVAAVTAAFEELNAMIAEEHANKNKDI